MIKKCIYCGTEEGPFHRDHIIPYSRGGKDEARNSVDACRPCNYEKGNMTPSAWKLSGLPQWIYGVEEKLAQKYKMTSRTRKSNAAGKFGKSGIPCYFCGGPRKKEDGFMEFYEAELPPYKNPRMRFNRHGGKEEYGDLSYPGSCDGYDYANGYSLVFLFSHADCGPNGGYWIRLKDLKEDPEDWIRQLNQRGWASTEVREVIRKIAQEKIYVQRALS